MAKARKRSSLESLKLFFKRESSSRSEPENRLESPTQVDTPSNNTILSNPTYHDEPGTQPFSFCSNIEHGDVNSVDRQTLVQSSKSSCKYADSCAFSSTFLNCESVLPRSRSESTLTNNLLPMPSTSAKTQPAKPNASQVASRSNKHAPLQSHTKHSSMSNTAGRPKRLAHKSCSSLPSLSSNTHLGAQPASRPNSLHLEPFQPSRSIIRHQCSLTDISQNARTVSTSSGPNKSRLSKLMTPKKFFSHAPSSPWSSSGSEPKKMVTMSTQRAQLRESQLQKVGQDMYYQQQSRNQLGMQKPRNRTFLPPPLYTLDTAVRGHTRQNVVRYKENRQSWETGTKHDFDITVKEQGSELAFNEKVMNEEEKMQLTEMIISGTRYRYRKERRLSGDEMTDSSSSCSFYSCNSSLKSSFAEKEGYHRHSSSFDSTKSLDSSSSTETSDSAESKDSLDISSQESSKESEIQEKGLSNDLQKQTDDKIHEFKNGSKASFRDRLFKLIHAKTGTQNGDRSKLSKYDSIETLVEEQGIWKSLQARKKKHEKNYNEYSFDLLPTFWYSPLSGKVVGQEYSQLVTATRSISSDGSSKLMSLYSVSSVSTPCLSSLGLLSNTETKRRGSKHYRSVSCSSAVLATICEE